MNDSLDCLQAYKEYLIEREMSENTIEKVSEGRKSLRQIYGRTGAGESGGFEIQKELLAQYKITSANSMLTALNHFFSGSGETNFA